jgi:hypothetical protein
MWCNCALGLLKGGVLAMRAAVAAARNMTGADVLSGLGNHFHRLYYAT